MTLERAATKEEELHRRDCEVRRLRDRLSSLKDEGIKIDCELQSSIIKLHHENECAVNEGRVLFSQASVPPIMEDESGQSRRSNFNQVHGQIDKTSGEKTPKTPCLGEKSRSFEGTLNSRKSGRRISSSGERTPVSVSELRLPHTGNISSRERTETDALHLKKRNGGGADTENFHKREKNSDGIRTNEAADESRHGSGSNSISRRQSYQSTSSYYGPSKQDPDFPSGQGRISKKFAEGKDREQRKQPSKGYETSTEDSACSIFRGYWNENTKPVAKALSVETSKVSMVQRFVDTQSKALDESDDTDEPKDCSERKSKEKVLTERKAVAAVLTFQRWRRTQLKFELGQSTSQMNTQGGIEHTHHALIERLFRLELKKVLEEAEEDEACLAKLKQDLATKDKHIAQLRYQLSSYEKASEAQTIQTHTTDANIKELQVEMLKSLERAAAAEEELHKRDCENRQLRDRLISLEDEGIRIDSELQSSIIKLHHDKESAINESRVLLSQLARKDEEVVLQCKEIDKLRATIAHLSTQQANSQKEIETLKAEQRAEVNNLQKKLQNAFAARHAKEVELVSYTEKCSGFDQERQSLLLQLHQALERADLASQRAEELQGKLHCTAEKRAKASEEIAGEMVEQLKRLTGHMKELETSMDKTALRFPVTVFQKKAVAISLAKLSNKLAQAEAASMDILSHAESISEPEMSGPLSVKNDSRRQVCFSLADEKLKCRTLNDHMASQVGKDNFILPVDRDISLTKFKNWIAWKWRWAASAAKTKNLLKQLQFKPVTTVATDPILPQSGRQQERIKKNKLGISQLDVLNLTDSEEEGTPMVRPRLGDLSMIMTHKLVPVIMIAWRAFAKLSNLEKLASARNQSLKKIISALPWWIRRVGERRVLERSFFHWLLLAMRANAQQQEQNQKRLVPLSRPTPHCKQGDNHSSSKVSTASPHSPVKTIYRDAGSQTDSSSRVSDADTKQEKSSTCARTVRSRSKSEPRIVLPPAAKNDTRQNLSADTLCLGRTQAQETKYNNSNATTAVKQLRGCQNSFPQELKEFQDAVSREMESVDHIPSQRPNTTHGRLTGTTQVDPAKQALKSVFNVCTSLAQALSEVRAQLFGADEGGGVSLARATDTNRQQHMRETMHHYALPIGRVGRFKAPHRQQPGEALAQPTKERWPSPAYAPGVIDNPQTRTVQHPYENCADQLQHFQQGKNEICRSFRNGRAEQQGNRGSTVSSNGLRQPARREKGNNYDSRNASVDSHPCGNSASKYQHLQKIRGDNNQQSSGGLEKGQVLLSDSGRGGGRTRFKTLDDNGDAGLSSSLTRAPSDCLHTTVVQILNQDNNKIGEVSIHTRPLNGVGDGSGRAESVSREPDSLRMTRLHSVNGECSDSMTINKAGKLHNTQDEGKDHPRPSSAPSRLRDHCAPSARPTSEPRLHQNTSAGRQRDALDRGSTMNFITSLRRKHCIGADYADLLRAEIVRLREDRLNLQDKSLHTTSENCRDMTLMRRPGWRNVY